MRCGCEEIREELGGEVETTASNVGPSGGTGEEQSNGFEDI